MPITRSSIEGMKVSKRVSQDGPGDEWTRVFIWMRSILLPFANLCETTWLRKLNRGQALTGIAKHLEVENRKREPLVKNRNFRFEICLVRVIG